jgi:DNA-binding XRE family transcriptional regulator
MGTVPPHCHRLFWKLHLMVTEESTMKIYKKADFIPAKPHTLLTTGEVIRMLRDLKGWTQAELANRCGITGTNISLLENDKVVIGKRRAEQIAKAFGIHPAIIMFPEYEGSEIKKVA